MSTAMKTCLALLFVGSTAFAQTPPPAVPAAPSAVAAAPTAPLSAEKMKEILARIDDRQRNTGDYQAKAFIEQREKNKQDVFYEAVFYRRDISEQFLILFLAPRTEAGKGYLRINRNLWMYDPPTGKWERRTERERIGGTNSRSQDFDPLNYARDFTHVYVGAERLGAFAVHHLKLTVKDGAKAPDPVIELWVDAATDNVLKQQDYALSGRLLRTAYYPKWEKVFSESKKTEVYYAKEIRIFDEVDKQNRTTVLIDNVDLRPLEPNIFTKAWLEFKSR